MWAGPRARSRPVVKCTRLGGCVPKRPLAQQLRQVLRQTGASWSLDWLGSESFGTAYRSFALRPAPDFCLVTMVELLLPHPDAAEISRTMRENLARKRASQPITAGQLANLEAPDTMAVMEAVLGFFGD